MKIKKGDNVTVMTGKNRGQSGKVIRVLPLTDQVVIEGINLLKKRTRPKKAGEKGQVIQIAYPLTASKVMINCRHCGKPTRVGYRVDAKQKVRICRRCKTEI